jgi:hypothetical protein
MLHPDQIPVAPPTWLDGWVTPTNLPGYIAAGIAVVALFFAIRSSNASHRSSRVAQTSLDRLEEEREKEQASKVSAWIVMAAQIDEPGEVPGHLWRIDIALRNASDTAIYGVHFYARPPHQLDHIFLGFLDAVPPSAEAATYRSYFISPPVPPDRQRAVAIGVMFRDGYGRVWNRDLFGYLSQLYETAAVRLKRDLILPARQLAMQREEGMRELHTIRPVED